MVHKRGSAIIVITTDHFGVQWQAQRRVGNNTQRLLYAGKPFTPGIQLRIVCQHCTNTTQNRRTTGPQTMHIGP